MTAVAVAVGSFPSLSLQQCHWARRPPFVGPHQALPARRRPGCPHPAVRRRAGGRIRDVAPMATPPPGDGA